MSARIFSASGSGRNYHLPIAFEVAAMSILQPGKPGVQPQPGHDVFIVMLGEFVGVGILAVIANSSDNLGKIAVALMAGWFLIALITNAPEIAQLTSKL